MAQLSQKVCQSIQDVFIGDNSAWIEINHINHKNKYSSADWHSNYDQEKDKGAVFIGTKTSNQHKYDKIELSGYSRGAVTTFLVAKQLNEVYHQAEVSIDAKEPVPGNLSEHSELVKGALDLTACTNIKHAKVTLGKYRKIKSLVQICIDKIKKILGTSTSADDDEQPSFLERIKSPWLKQLLPSFSNETTLTLSYRNKTHHNARPTNEITDPQLLEDVFGIPPTAAVKIMNDAEVNRLVALPNLTGGGKERQTINENTNPTTKPEHATLKSEMLKLINQISGSTTTYCFFSTSKKKSSLFSLQVEIAQKNRLSSKEAVRYYKEIVDICSIQRGYSNNISSLRKLTELGLHTDNPDNQYQKIGRVIKNAINKNKASAPNSIAKKITKKAKEDVYRNYLVF